MTIQVMTKLLTAPPINLGFLNDPIVIYCCSQRSQRGERQYGS